MQLDDVLRAGRLVQPVDVLGDDSVQQAAPLQLGHGVVALVRGGPGDVPPAQVAARPVPLPGRGGAGERLVCHRLGPPGQPGRPAVVRDAGLGGQARPAQHDDPARPDQVRNFSNGIGRTLTEPGSRAEWSLGVAGSLSHPSMLPYLSGWTTPLDALSVRGDAPPGPPAIRRLGGNTPAARPRLPGQLSVVSYLMMALPSGTALPPVASDAAP